MATFAVNLFGPEAHFPLSLITSQQRVEPLMLFHGIWFQRSPAHPMKHYLHPTPLGLALWMIAKDAQNGL
jgi:hypothetical protein